jgi:hypothetical protein
MMPRIDVRFLFFVWAILAFLSPSGFFACVRSYLFKTICDRFCVFGAVVAVSQHEVIIQKSSVLRSLLP